MSEANGPALFVHNDAVVTDSDFENLVKLGAGTKKAIKHAVGNFGLGFSSVFNITDIPSIISRNTMVCLDPNIKFLKNRIRSNALPGIRLNLSVLNKQDRMNYADQFKPYENIFGCDPFNEEFFYNSTLFRLPLRHEPSKISDLIYDESQIEQLFEILYLNASSLLLFTQSVGKIEFHVLEDVGEDAVNSKLLFEFEKKPVRYLKKHEQALSLNSNCQEKDLDFIVQSSLLKASLSAAARQIKINTGLILCNSIRTDRDNFKQMFRKSKLYESNGEARNDYYLVVSSFDPKYLVNGAGYEKFQPCVGMAVEIE